MTKEFIDKMRELGKDPNNKEIVKERLQQERDKNWRILETLKPGDEIEINKEWFHENMNLPTKRPDFRNFVEGLFPAYRLPLSFPPFPDALERRGQTPGILREFEGNGPAPVVEQRVARLLCRKRCGAE